VIEQRQTHGVSQRGGLDRSRQVDKQVNILQVAAAVSRPRWHTVYTGTAHLATANSQFTDG